MTAQPGAGKNRAEKPGWHRAVARFTRSDTRKAVGQLANTLLPYLALWALMVYLLHRGISYWLILPLIVLAAGLLVRIFIFFHDCCHDSFFDSRRANTVLGYITGILTFTPYEDWRHAHLVHHATTSDLDRRGVGDIWTMTVDEYRQAPRLRRLGYRVFRNPLVMLGLGPAFVFFITQRLAHKGARRRERLSVVLTNLALAAILGLAALTIGLKTYLIIQMPVMIIAGALGIWLFYVQHQFEGVYWARHETWDPIRAALDGSSYYRLPRVLQWFSGNIGLHHIHHLRPRIPNYHLQRCLDEIRDFQVPRPLTLRSSLRSLWLNLWDETQGRLVSFRALKTAAPPNTH